MTVLSHMKQSPNLSLTYSSISYGKILQVPNESELELSTVLVNLYHVPSWYISKVIF